MYILVDHADPLLLRAWKKIYMNTLREKTFLVYPADGQNGIRDDVLYEDIGMISASNSEDISHILPQVSKSIPFNV